MCRKAARGYLEDKKHSRIRITESNLEKYLGKEKITFEDANEEDEVGIVRDWPGPAPEAILFRSKSM